MKKKFLVSILTSIFAFSVIEKPSYSAPDLIQSGPMLGYSEMRESLIWVQTKKEAKVKIIYWEKENPKNKFSTEEVNTTKKDAFIAKLIADEVSPGKKYTYEVYIDGQKVERNYKLQFQTPELWQWRKDPTNFTVAFGSCAYINEPEFDRPGKPYGGDMQIYQHISEKEPDIMLWGGDNTYLRESDWYSRTGMLKRYTHTRSLPEMQALLASSQNYAIWDDHDYGPNDSDISFRNREDSLDVFKLFWGNPTYGTKEAPATFTKFEWGDVEFFLLDNRMYRDPDNKKEPKTMLGKKQLEWFKNSLIASKATFKMVVIGNQFINPVVEDYIEDHERYKQEKDDIISFLDQNKIKGIFFLTGDRHQTELNVLKRENAYPIYDLTVSPFTSTAYDASKEKNYLRVPSTIYTDRNFSILSFSGTKKDRSLKITIFDKNGKEVWNRTIKASELNYSK
ncbi:MAG: alkaline phosphatase D family protein [Candidatus Sericytochromatia bacterium]